MNVFKTIAQFYDPIYSDKDYLGEVEELEKRIKPKSLILDIGTGTGSHAIILQQRGHKVIGVEPTDEMRQIAFGKGIRHIINSSIEDLDLKGKHDEFDAAIAMFDVIDYIQSDEGFENALFNMHRLLKKGGLLFLEGWNKDKIKDNFDPEREKEFILNGIKGKRISRTYYKNGKYSIDFEYFWNKTGYRETHILTPRLGEDNIWFQKQGFKILDQQTDDYSVKIWLKKI